MVSDTAGDPLTQAKLEVIRTVTESMSAKAEVVYPMLSVPTAVVPTYHWYTGLEPPFAGVAVKVTSVPAQIVLSLSLEAMVTLAVSGERELQGLNTVSITSFPSPPV